MMEPLDLRGYESGLLTTIRPTIYREKSTGYIIWECVCRCGNHSYVTSHNLKSKHSKSCGCSRRKKA